MDKRFGGNDYKRPYSTRSNNIKSVNGKSGSSSSSNSNNPFVNSPFSTSRYGNFSSSSSNNSFAYNRNNAASSSSSSTTSSSSSSNNIGRLQTREEIDNYKYSWRNEAYRNKFIQQLRCIVDDEQLASNNPADEGYLSSA